MDNHDEYAVEAFGEEDENEDEATRYDSEDEFENEDEEDEWQESLREESNEETDEEVEKENVEERKKSLVERSSVVEEDDGRRKTIYELDSYPSSVPSGIEIVETVTKLRLSLSMGLPGIARIDLSPLTQRIVGCVIGENVTTEYPWIYVNKEVIEDNIDLHDESSDFLAVKNEIHTFPDTKILIGYAPSSAETGQFYICITEAGRDAVMKHIELLRNKQENRVRNAVYKTIGSWKALGSQDEVDDTIVKNARPLFEVEVESTADLLNLPINLTNRGANEQRDGYVELMPYRQTFDNVTKKLVDRAEQATPVIRSNDAQTDPSMPTEMWSQYQYDHSTVNTTAYDEEEANATKEFLDEHVDKICDQVQLNATWDIYTNDYANLVVSERDTHPPVTIGYTEHQSYYDGKLCAGKVINDLCWHPLWTGIAVAAYTDHSKSDFLVGPTTKDEVLRACYGTNRVLIWSFSDCLSPKLILESPREVTAVSVCPLDGNVIVGGCKNGQIAIWHIPGKIEQMEAVMVNTSAQVKYKIAMRSLLSWMRESTSSSIVRPTAVSSLMHSQKAAITKIVWIPVYNKIDSHGRISSLPADATLNDLTWQFTTACEDGTIAFWDLKWRPSEKEEAGRAGAKSKKKMTVPRPDALVQATSPYKVLDRVFKPIYMVEVKYPDDDRRAVLTTLSIHAPKMARERMGAIFAGEDDIITRRYYKPVVKKPDFEMEPVIFVGTVEGDCAHISWEGYEFATGVTVNKENGRWNCWSKIHDGPVTHAVRSKYLRNIILTIGGKIFALWRDNVEDPVLWRKCTVRYTACSWGAFRPTVIILGRIDGTVEIWDLIVKSHEPTFTQSVSGRIITGIYMHELYLNPQCVGFCDYNGTLRVFCAPRVMLFYKKEDIEWLRNFVDREIDRMSEFKKWQKKWSDSNSESIAKRKMLAETEAEKKRVMAEETIKSKMAEAATLAAASKASKMTRKPEQFLEEARQRWKSMELKRMQDVILEKKGLRKDDLEKQRAPVMKLRQDARSKKRKIREILQLKDKIFEDTIAFLFPEQYHERKPIELPRPSSTLEREDEDVPADLNYQEEEKAPEFASPAEKYIYDFMEIQTEALVEIQQNPYKHSFNWRKILKDGKLRREALDVELRKRSKHRQKYAMRKSSAKASNVNLPLTEASATKSKVENDGGDEVEIEDTDKDKEQDKDIEGKVTSVP